MERPRRGKGTKIMLMTEAEGVLISLFTASAQMAEVNTIETLVEQQIFGPTLKKLIYDKAADADWLRNDLSAKGIEQVTPHRKS